jgi:GT2 family glycosyltransferase
MKRSHSGYLHKADLCQDLSAVTAACVMIKRSVFENVQGFDERLSVAFNDVDLCLRINESGQKVVFTPYAELYHYESKSRGTEDSKEKVRRFQSEIELMRTKWEKLLKKGDPYYNKNLSLTKWNYSLRSGAHMKSV